MLKKVFLLFIILIAGLYYGPIFYEQREISTRDTAEDAISLDSGEDDGIHPLPVSGFEFYVGQPIETYEARHGSPTAVYQGEDTNTSWRVYHDDFDKFLQIEVKDGIIESLFVLGSGVQTGTIQIGMNRANVYDETQLSRQFDLNWQDQQVSLKLKKNEWEHFPLIQYDNDSFAMLYFHPETEEIYAIRYLSSEALLNLNYYTVKGVDVNPAPKSNTHTGKLLENYINATRKEQALNLLGSEERLNEYGRSVLESLGNKALTFTGLSDETIEAAENEGITIAYNGGTKSLDEPMRFGLMQLEENNRRLFLEPDFTTFSVVSSRDDLLFIFEAERGDSDAH